MKKSFSFCLLVLVMLKLNSQNVGIGTTLPTEKLDVNGNINLGGNLKVNGASGQSGQVLMTNSMGQTVWGNEANEYKNVVMFTQTSNWTIPLGVTEVMLELWGGGGGGAVGGGGGSGLYLRVLKLAVVPNTNVTVTIGTGGAGALTANAFGTNGGATSVFISSTGFTYTANGGNAGKTDAPGSCITVGGVPFTNMIYYSANGGQPTVEDYSQVGTNEFVRITKYGDGGNSPLLNYGGGSGGFNSYNLTTALYLKFIKSNAGSAFGAGGGGGENGQGNYGGSGHAGRVHIWYN